MTGKEQQINPVGSLQVRRARDGDITVTAEVTVSREGWLSIAEVVGEPGAVLCLLHSTMCDKYGEQHVADALSCIDFTGPAAALQ